MKASLLFLALSLAGVHGGDWRQFRGPYGNGVSDETGLPTKLDASRHIAWQSDLPGRGLSSPIIVGERVFVTCSSGPKQDRLHVICFRAGDGVKLWERQFWATGRTMCHEKTSVAAPTPASDGRRLFAIFSSNDLFCLDLEGNLLWLRGLTRDYPNASNSLGMSSSLVVADETVIAQVENDSESFTAGIDARNGLNRWKLDRPRQANWTSPLLVPGAGGRSVVALQSSKGLLGVEPATGREVWNYSEGASTIPSGAVGGDVVFVPSFGLTALKTSTGSAAPEKLWRANQLRPGTASPTVLGEHIFSLNDAGVLSCGAVTNGNRLWQLRLKGPFSASPVSAGVHLYLVNEKGLAQVVDPTKPEGAVVGEMDLGETVLGTPSIAGGALYVRSDRKLWKIAGT